MKPLFLAKASDGTGDGARGRTEIEGRRTQRMRSGRDGKREGWRKRERERYKRRESEKEREINEQ